MESRGSCSDLGLALASWNLTFLTCKEGVPAVLSAGGMGALAFELKACETEDQQPRSAF